MTTIPGLFAIGEANFSDHGANRLGANSLLQACVDGYYIAPYTLQNYLADHIQAPKTDTSHAAFDKAEQNAKDLLNRLVAQKGTKTAEEFHREIGKILYDKCGLSRSEQGLKEAIASIQKLREEFQNNLLVPGEVEDINSELEKAGRVNDYMELAELMCIDALERNESCGAHFREEYQTEDGEAERNDKDYAYSAAWEWTGEPSQPVLCKEPLQFEYVQPTKRSYK
jgi:succinate dehydrogenase / fumarate reductase flavoprotein subunit